MNWQPMLMSQESEYLTVVRNPSTTGIDVIDSIVENMSRLAPSLPGSRGFFNAYGRVYVDATHLEFAASEADSPEDLLTVIDCQHQLLSASLKIDDIQRTSTVVANCNHDGLLRESSLTWGTHENYLIRVPPSQLVARLLPFLATRVFSGSGGMTWPSGDFVAGVRVALMQHDSGGRTTSQRALFSLARDENLTSTPQMWRLHLIHGDANRSEFSLRLKFGTTALVVRMLETHPEWIVPLPGTPSPASGRKAFWMSVARCVNRLASSDKLLTVDPMALRIQRLYLDRCQKMSDACRDSPDWVLRILDDWEQTLGAMASNDHTWLASHLDPWIKHSLMIEYLRRIGSNWFDASTNLGLASELALLHQSYHTIAGDPSIFDAFEHAGMLQHRNRVNIRPGEEPNPFVPESLTRSSVRAKFIREHADEAGWIVDWATARNLIDGRQVAFEPPIQSRPRGD